MRVTFFGTYDESTHPRIRVLRHGFEALGAEVDTCNVPLEFGTAARVALAASPWRAGGLVLRVLRTWVRLGRMARRLPTPDAVVVGYLGVFDVHLAKLLFRRSTIVLDHLVPLGDTVRDRGLGSGRLAALLDRADRAARQAADIVLFDTAEQHASTPCEHGYVVPVGADDAWFGKPDARSETEAHVGPLRLLYVGLYTPLHGMPVLASALAHARDLDVSVTLVGDGQDRAEVESIVGDDARITFVDWVASADLPALHACHDVAVGIFDGGEKARRVAPTKVFQAQAAGCAVLTSDTAAQRRVLGDGARFVPADDADAIVDALRELSTDPALVQSLRTASRAQRERHRPATVVAPLHAALTKCDPR